MRIIKRAFGFLFHQTMKTVRRPARLFTILYGFLKTIYRFFRKNLVSISGPLIAVIALRLPPHLTPKSFDHILAASYFIKGTILLDGNRPREAWLYFRRCLSISTDPRYYFVAAACLLVGLGRYQEAMAIFSRANALRAERAKGLGVAHSPVRFLESIWYGAFGHLAQIQYLVQLNILENRRREDTIVYVPPYATVANRFLLEQWRPHLNIIEDPRDLPLSLDALHSLSFDFLAPRLTDGTTAYYWGAAEDAIKRWKGEKRGPVLTFPLDVEARGYSALAAVGIPRGAWFVALHVRDSASKQYHADLHNVLNADIVDYLPAIRAITDRGGWVIRLGDPMMTPLPHMPNVFDYCHSAIRSDWMDVFLLARCRFFLGTSSGPAYVPIIYQVPTVLTNWWPLAQRPWDDQAIFIPKLYRYVENGAALTLSRALSEPFGYCNSIDQLKKGEGVTVEDNSPDDIRDATIEMIERLERTVAYSADDVRLRESAMRIFVTNGARGTGNLARDFLRRNKTIVG